MFFLCPNYHYFCYVLHNTLYKNITRKAVLSLPCFLGTGLLLIVGDVALTNHFYSIHDNYFDAEIKIDEISYFLVLVNKILNDNFMLQNMELFQHIEQENTNCASI
jgi:hypothetical protein